MSESAITEFKIVEAARKRFAKVVVANRRVDDSWSEVIDYCRTAWPTRIARSSAFCFSTRRTA